MEMRVIYCTGSDQDVTVILADGHEANGPGGDLCGSECLEIGRRCTGTTCPICAVPARARAEGARAKEPAAR